MAGFRANSLYGLLGFLIPSAVMLLAYPVLVKHVGAGAFGIYLLATSFSGILAALDLGVSAATVKFVAEGESLADKRGVGDILAASLLFYGCAGFLGASAIWLATPWLLDVCSIEPGMRGQATIVFRLSAVQFAVSFVNTVWLSLFKGMHRFQLSSLVLSILSLLTYGGAVLGVLFRSMGLVGITAVSLAANVLVAVLALIMGLALCRRAGIELSRARPTVTTFKRMFGFSAAMLVSSVAGLLHSQGQKILIGALMGPQFVTSYYIGVWGPAKVNAATLAICEPLFPGVAAANARDHSMARRMYYRYLASITLLSLIALAPFALVPEVIFGLWLGSASSPMIPEVARIVAAGLFLNAVSHPAFHVVNGLGRPWINTGFMLLSTGLLYGTVLAISRFQPVGLPEFAWATSLSLGGPAILYLIVCEWLLIRRPREMAVTSSR